MTCPLFEMIYDFVCHDCKIVTDVERPTEQAGEGLICPWCEQPMRRIFYAPRLLGRQKPKGFVWEKGKLDAWDDRLAGFQLAESKGPNEIRKLRSAFGEQVYQKVLSHKKERYA